MKRKVIFVVGPTASGKSALAVKIAKKLGSEVISADSMQIYKGMDVGTAKATEAEKDGIIHHLLDVCAPETQFSVAEYAEAAEKEIERISSSGAVPVVCGGTGLYVESLLYPLNFSNVAKCDELRKKLEDEYDLIGGQAMHERLLRLDEETALKLHPNDKKRIVRALEIALTTGKKVGSETKEFKCQPLIIVLNFDDRALLYERIDRRVDVMFQNGLVDEIKRLLLEGANFSCQSFQAIGYKEFEAYFSGEQTLEKTKELIKQHSRNYAKRQLTWFKRYSSAKWFSPFDEDGILAAVDEFLEK